MGSVVAQGLSAVSQFLLVAWLTPADFGIFASANAALIVLVALTNLGEVNAFLTGRIGRPEELLRTTYRVNLCLAATGALVGVLCHVLNRGTLGTVIVLVALTIPLTGGSLAWNAVAIRAMDLRGAILGQFAGAGAKLACGVTIAAVTGSAVALPLALAAGAATNIAVTRSITRQTSDALPPTHVTTIARSGLDRVRWGAQSLVQFFGAQSDYLVLALLANPHVLGIYFLAYQATVGISALVSGPMMKSSMVELGRSEGSDLGVARQLAIQASGYVALVCAGAGGVVMLVSPQFPGAWSAAGAPLVLLLGSLTGRLLTPILEAQLLASGQVSRSFWVNGVDAVGTALAACTVVMGDVLLVALAVSVWKLSVSALRCFAVFGRSGAIVVVPAIASLGAHVGTPLTLPQGSQLGAGVLMTIGAAILLASRLRVRSSG